MADCREIARRRGWKQVVTVGIDPASGKFQVASYGETKALCDEAGQIARVIHAMVEAGGDVDLFLKKLGRA
ncbi:MAG: hypothetical protein KGL39_19565 [Patescibacteria group bacterium]|nr:hypothetical protein [Patescibacteria group bacterium]